MDSIKDRLFKHTHMGVLETISPMRKTVIKFGNEDFLPYAIFGVCVVDWVGDVPVPDSLTDEQIATARFFFTRAAAREFFTDVLSDRLHPFIQTPDDCHGGAYGFPFEEVVNILTAREKGETPEGRELPIVAEYLKRMGH